MITAKYWLQDQRGPTHRVSLNDPNTILALSVSGIGVTYDNKYAGIDNGFFVRYNGEQKQGAIVCDLLLSADGYARYRSLADYVVNADKLYFVYNPEPINSNVVDRTEYTAEVKLRYLNKGVRSSCGDMKTTISFELVTPWCTVETITATGTATITAGGQLGTSVKITTTSALTNPVLTMTDADGEFQRLALTTTKASGIVFEYSNHYYDSHIHIGTADGIQYADLSTAIFGHSRKAFTLALSGASMTIEVKKWWRTV